MPTSTRFATSSGSPRVEWTAGLPLLGQGITVMALCKITTYTSNGWVFTVESAGGATVLAVYCTATPELILYNNGTDVSLWTQDYQQWFWVAVTYTPSGRIRVYLKRNGEDMFLAADAAGIASFTVASIGLGYDAGNIDGLGGGNSTFQYASFKIWQRILSPADIETETRARQMLNTRGTWFANDFPTVFANCVIDQSGADHRGTLTGTPTSQGEAPQFQAMPMPMSLYVASGPANPPPFDQATALRYRGYQRAAWLGAEMFPQSGVKTGTGLPTADVRTAILGRRGPTMPAEVPPQVVAAAQAPPVDPPVPVKAASRLPFVKQGDALPQATLPPPDCLGRVVAFPRRSGPPQAEVMPQTGVFTGAGPIDAQAQALASGRRLPTSSAEVLPSPVAVVASPPPDLVVVAPTRVVRPSAQSTDVPPATVAPSASPPVDPFTRPPARVVKIPAQVAEVPPQSGVFTGAGFVDAQPAVSAPARRPSAQNSDVPPVQSAPVQPPPDFLGRVAALFKRAPAAQDSAPPAPPVHLDPVAPGRLTLVRRGSAQQQDPPAVALFAQAPIEQPSVRRRPPPSIAPPDQAVPPRIIPPPVPPDLQAGVRRWVNRLRAIPGEVFPQIGVKTGTGLPGVEGTVRPWWRRLPFFRVDELPPKVTSAILASPLYAAIDDITLGVSVDAVALAAAVDDVATVADVDDVVEAVFVDEIKLEVTES